MEKITAFRDEYSFLSNFYPSPLTYNGELYGTAEAAFQAAKTLDPTWRARIRCADSPGEAKRLGRQCPMRLDWHDIKVAVMRDILIAKFKNEKLARRLLATAPLPLEEHNTWNDTFWGICNGKGRNTLGHLLMMIRAGLSGAQAAKGAHHA